MPAQLLDRIRGAYKIKTRDVPEFTGLWPERGGGLAGERLGLKIEGILIPDCRGARDEVGGVRAATVAEKLLAGEATAAELGGR